MPIETLQRSHGTEPDLDESISELFTYKAWDSKKIEAGEAVREPLKAAYKAILKNVPSSPTRSRALNMLVDARMLANAAITFEGKA